MVEPQVKFALGFNLSEPEIKELLMKPDAFDIVRIKPPVRETCVYGQEIACEFQRDECDGPDLHLWNWQCISRTCIKPGRQCCIPNPITSRRLPA